MKLLIATLTLFSAFAGASQLPFVRSAQLSVRQLDKNHFVNMGVNFASISIDKTNRMVRLYVAGGDIQDVAIDLPVVKVIQHSCSRTTIAMEDARPVDGIKQTIVINEQIPAPHVRCALVYKKNPTRVEYRTVGVNRMNGKEFRGTSKFAGPHLEIVRPEFFPINH